MGTVHRDSRINVFGKTTAAQPTSTVPEDVASTSPVRLKLPRDRLRRAELSGYAAIIEANRACASVSALDRSAARPASAAPSWGPPPRPTAPSPACTPAAPP